MWNNAVIQLKPGRKTDWFYCAKFNTTTNRNKSIAIKTINTVYKYVYMYTCNVKETSQSGSLVSNGTISVRSILIGRISNTNKDNIKEL